MIVVTRLNESRFAVNPDLIERVHANPDTTLVMVDGASYIVTESLDEIIEKIAAYRAQVIALAHGLPTHGPARALSALGQQPVVQPLELVSSREPNATGEVLLHPRTK